MPVTQIDAITIDNCMGDEVRVCRVNASDSDGFAEEVDIAVAGAGVRAGEDNDKIAVAGIINCRLNIIKIIRPIVINDDYFRPTGNSQEQEDRNKKELFKIQILAS
jgi:hypothetical protein